MPGRVYRACPEPFPDTVTLILHTIVSLSLFLTDR